MDNLLEQAIYCDCYIPEYKRYKILGSITCEGFLEILRPHKNKTVIHVEECVVACAECGYKRYVKLQNVVVNQPAYTNETKQPIKQ